ncbi:MAG: hypothetical protein ACQEWV_18010 [Bacillota bacterium]
MLEKTAGKIALQRGPVVYCIEECDKICIIYFYLEK